MPHLRKRKARVCCLDPNATGSCGTSRVVRPRFIDEELINNFQNVANFLETLHQPMKLKSKICGSLLQQINKLPRDVSAMLI